MIKNIISALIIITIITSCCNESDENSGIIWSDLYIEQFGITNYYCLDLPDTACVRSKDQYNELFKIVGQSKVCNEIVIPEVDFSKFSILINHRTNKGKKFYHKNVTVDSNNKVVTYLISIESCPIVVDSETESYNIVLVPKIGEDYKVEYK